MTEHDLGHQANPASMPASAPTAQPDALAARLQALQASRSGQGEPQPDASTASATPSRVPQSSSAAPYTASRRPKPSGPAPSRIVAAAASVSAGIGLIALMAGAQQDVVVQVNPTPVTVQPANIVVEMQPGSSATGTSPEVQVRVVEPATSVERSAPQARVATQSEGS